jgi:hypothetical protein
VDKVEEVEARKIPTKAETNGTTKGDTTMDRRGVTTMVGTKEVPTKADINGTTKADTKTDRKGMPILADTKEAPIKVVIKEDHTKAANKEAPTKVVTKEDRTKVDNKEAVTKEDNKEVTTMPTSSYKTNGPNKVGEWDGKDSHKAAEKDGKIKGR